MNYIQEYIDKIRSGEITVGVKIKQLYFNTIEPILKGESDKYYFDEEVGSRFLKFAGFCKQSKGQWAGKPLELALFQKAKWQSVMGILRRDNHFRRFTEVLDLRARKNFKSTEHAAVALFLTREEPGAEVYTAAVTSAQAKRIWDESRSMLNQSKHLTGNKSPKKGLVGNGPFQVRHAPTPTISIPERNAYYRVLSSNTDALDGLNASAAVVDEIHALSREIYDLLKQSMSTREQPLLSLITTAGFEQTGLFDDLYSYATLVLAGEAENDSLFALMYELDDPGEIHDESMWPKANPALGIGKSIEFLRQVVLQMQSDKSFANTVKTKDFNIRGVDNKAWLSFDEIRNETKVDYSKYNGSVAIGGFDLSKTTDMTAFTSLFFDKDLKTFVAETMYWVTKDFLDKSRHGVVPYYTWFEQGLLRVSGTSHIDYHDVADYVYEEMFTKRRISYVKICYDSYSAVYLVDELMSFGYAKEYCLLPVIQGFKTLSLPTQLLESHLKDKKLVYNNNPITKWGFTNAETVLDRNGNRMLQRVDSQKRRKIDGPATILNCYVELNNNLAYYENMIR